MRDGRRFYPATSGKEYEMSLTGTCMGTILTKKILMTNIYWTKTMRVKINPDETQY